MHAKSGREKQTMVNTSNSGYVNPNGGFVNLPRIGMNKKMTKNSGIFPNKGIGNIFQNVPGIGFWPPQSLGRNGVGGIPEHGLGKPAGINNNLMSPPKPVGQPRGLVRGQVLL